MCVMWGLVFVSVGMVWVGVTVATVCLASLTTPLTMDVHVSSIIISLCVCECVCLNACV